MKKISALILALLMIVSVVALSSCGETAKTDDGTKATASTTAAADETTDLSYTSELGTLDYGGTEIRMIVDAYKYSTDEFYTEGIDGSIVNDAVYERNSAVESALNVELNITRVETTSDKAVLNELEKSITAGDSLYDIATIPGYRAASANYGYYVNLKTVENLNLSKLYWTQGFNEIMGNDTTQYLASGAYSISMIRGMYCTVFNKDMFDTRHLTSPYDLVKSNDWTFEKQLELIKDTYIDKNGSTTADADDFYGFAGGTYTTSDPYWVSWNCKFLTMNNEGQYELNLDGEKFADIVSKVHDLFFNNANAYCVSTSSSDSNGTLTTEAIAKMFYEEKAMMITIEMCLVEKTIVPNFDGNYGIVPLPKYNSDQEGYYTHTSDRLTTMAIVSTVPEADRAMMGAVMETIACESYKTVFPAYYSASLSSRFLQDPSSQSMLDLMYTGIKIEGAFLYNSKFKMLTTFRSAFTSGEATSSTLKENETTWNTGLESLNKTFSAAAE